MTFDVPRPDVAFGCRVIRVVRPDCQKEDPEAHPNSGAFTDHKTKPQEPLDCMSVFLEDRILAAGRKPSQLLPLFKPGSRLCWITFEELGQDNIHQELLDVPDDDFFPGHVVAHDPKHERRCQPAMSNWARQARWYAGDD